MKYVSLILITVMLAGCATTPAIQYTNHAEYMAAIGTAPTEVPPPLPMPSTPPPVPPPPPAQDGVSGWDVLGAIVLIPLLVPIAMIGGGYGNSYRGVHCKSYTYKDQYHTKCY